MRSSCCITLLHLATAAIVTMAGCRSSELPRECLSDRHDLCVDGSRLFRAGASRVRTALRRSSQRRVRHRRDEVDGVGQPAAGREGPASSRRVLVERARPHAGVEITRCPGVVSIAQCRRHPFPLVDPDGYWTGFSARMRVLAYNTKMVKAEDAPRSIFDLAESKWKGQVAMADPRFGSTSFHVAALYALAGDDKMDAFFKRLKANDVRIVDGNSVVRDLVARGEVKVGLTDTDDVNVAIENGQPVSMVFPDRDGLGVPVMPNMVSLIANAPHPEEARRLIDYLLSADVERQLAQSEAVQIPLHAGVPGPKNIPPINSFKPMTLDFAKAASRVDDVTTRLATILGL